MASQNQIYKTLVEYGIQDTNDPLTRPIMLNVDHVQNLVDKGLLRIEEPEIVITEKGKKTLQKIAQKRGLLPLEAYQLILQDVPKAYGQTQANQPEKNIEEEWTWKFYWRHYLLQWSPSLTILLHSPEVNLGKDVATSNPQEILITGYGELWDKVEVTGDTFALLSPYFEPAAACCKALIQNLQDQKTQLQEILENFQIPKLPYQGPISI